MRAPRPSASRASSQATSRYEAVRARSETPAGGRRYSALTTGPASGATSGAPIDSAARPSTRATTQVFANLIGNAVKFSPKGTTIRVEAVVKDGEVVFSVADGGPGIARDEMARIFEPYWSGQRHGERSTGLGLFISQGIVRAHGGRIWVESQLGRGSSFHFALPLGPGRAPAHVDDSHQRDPP
jgi:hypothetical protein